MTAAVSVVVVGSRNGVLSAKPKRQVRYRDDNDDDDDAVGDRVLLIGLGRVIPASRARPPPAAAAAAARRFTGVD